MASAISCILVVVLKDLKLQYILQNKPLLNVLAVLAWSAHTNKVTTKGFKTLWFRKRKLHSASLETKTTAYKSSVRPTWRYSSAAWNLHHKKDINKIESVQKRADTFTTNHLQKIKMIYEQYTFNVEIAILKE